MKFAYEVVQRLRRVGKLSQEVHSSVPKSARAPREHDDFGTIAF